MVFTPSGGTSAKTVVEPSAVFRDTVTADRLYRLIRALARLSFGASVKGVRVPDSSTTV